MQRVAFDTWAWFEVLAQSAAGNRLSRDFLDNPEARVLTPSLALAEMSAKLARLGLSTRIPEALAAMEAGSEVVPLTTKAAMKVGPSLLDLRKSWRQASTADAVMLATARDHGARLVSNDRAFADQDDVLLL